MLGEPGTEQFTISVHVDGQLVRAQPIHDPFIHNRTTIQVKRWAAFKGIFKPLRLNVHVDVDGTPGIMREVMMIDLAKVARDDELQRTGPSDEHTTIGFYKD